jgi:hypothetical protein
MGGIPAIPAGVHAGPLRLSDVGPTLLDLLHIRGFDPSVGAELEDLAPELRARVLGHDRSDAFVAADSTACRWPALMAEGMFYGPPQTRLLSAGGRDILVHDDSGEVQVHERCRAVGGDAAPALTDSERSWLVQLDRWRETLAPRSLRVEDDPELDRRLRSLGYLK